MSTELLNIDCMEYMATQEDNSFDLAVVDPPYGINFSKTHTGNGWTVRESKDWDKRIPDASYFRELFRVSKNQIIWGGNYMVEHLPPSMGWIFWDKGQRNFSLADGELAFTSFERALRVFQINRGAIHHKFIKEGGRIHPTQKPIELYSWILNNYSKKGERILDTHLGSASSAIAAHYFGVDFVGCELDKEYYDSAKDRFDQQTRQEEMSLVFA